MAVFTNKKQALHDYIVGTVVIIKASSEKWQKYLCALSSKAAATLSAEFGGLLLVGTALWTIHQISPLKNTLDILSFPPLCNSSAYRYSKASKK
jgi:hypothetical protein